MAGHYARFEYRKTYGHLSENRIRQVFGDFTDFMPHYVKGKKKGLMKATMVEKVCVYGGAMKNGDIARPRDIPQIWLIPHDISWELSCDRDVAEMVNRYDGKQVWLHSGSVGVQAHLPSGRVETQEPTGCEEEIQACIDAAKAALPNGSVWQQIEWLTGSRNRTGTLSHEKIYRCYEAAKQRLVKIGLQEPEEA